MGGRAVRDASPARDVAERHAAHPVLSDRDALLRDATSYGDLAGLADAIEASARRLEQAYGRLSADERDRPVPTRIWHEGRIVRDSPMSIGELILGNGDFHLAMHT